MPRTFNTAGPCKPDWHYMLPPERRLGEVRDLIAGGAYFVVHAPRQVGKTTSFLSLARSLTAEGRFIALHTSCEQAQTAGDDEDRGIRSVLAALREDAKEALPSASLPPPPDESEPSSNRLRDLLARWCQRMDRPVVLFLDEIDACRNGTLISVLRQLRAGYPHRPGSFPQSVALIGMRDVRDYRASLRDDGESLGTASPFNIKTESLTIRDFSRDEIAELYAQHRVETGQTFDDEALAEAWELTRGQPWLVNALARQIVEKQVTDRALTIEAVHVRAAAETLIERRDTHLDSLIERLREERVRRVIEPILAGELLPADSLADDIGYVRDLGLVSEGPAGLMISNGIYREVIPRALAWVMQTTLPVRQSDFVAPDGRLRVDELLESFARFWLEHAEFLLAGQPYPEAAPHLIFMAFLQRVVNGGGRIEREYAVGSGRLDLHVQWPHPGGFQELALELKVWRDGRPDPLERGLDQISGYLARLHLQEGVLVIFDRRAAAVPLPERVHRRELDHHGRTITVLRL